MKNRFKDFCELVPGDLVIIDIGVCGKRTDCYVVLDTGVREVAREQIIQTTSCEWGESGLRDSPVVKMAICFDILTTTVFDEWWFSADNEYEIVRL